MSVETIGRIATPSVWTLHDCWLFMGSEHHPKNSADERFRLGYTKNNRSEDESGLDINRLVWERKKRVLPRKGYAVAPSSCQYNDRYVME